MLRIAALGTALHAVTRGLVRRPVVEASSRTELSQGRKRTRCVASGGTLIIRVWGPGPILFGHRGVAVAWPATQPANLHLSGHTRVWRHTAPLYRDCDDTG